MSAVCSCSTSAFAPVQPASARRPAITQHSTCRAPARRHWGGSSVGQRRGRDSVSCESFLSSIFGGSKGSSGSVGPAVADPTEEGGISSAFVDYSGENLDCVVLTELPGGGGQIVYRNGWPVDPIALEALCDAVGWPRRPMNKVEAALASSFLVASLTVEDAAAPEGGSSSSSSSGSSSAPGRLIGLARCTSDGAFNATIWDVLVHPEFQGLGLGKALVEGMVRTLLRREITNITLFADANVVDFYRQLGFEADPEGIKGMFWRPPF